MSDKNGTLPPGAEVPTIEMIRQWSRRTVPLPRLSANAGRTVEIVVRAISRSEWVGCLPPPPPGSKTWTEDEWDKKAEEWFASLEMTMRHERMQVQAATAARIVSVAAVEPALTIEQARELGDDVDSVAEVVLTFSGLKKE